jgi:hypothetical protein
VREGVEAELRILVRRIRTMAFETAIRKDWPYIAIERDFLSDACGNHRREDHEKGLSQRNDSSSAPSNSVSSWNSVAPSSSTRHSIAQNAMTGHLMNGRSMAEKHSGSHLQVFSLNSKRLDVVSQTGYCRYYQL